MYRKEKPATQYIFWILLLVLGLGSCQQPQGFKEPEDPLDAGREFVRAVLDGDFEEANLYITENAEDQEIYKRYVSFMKKQSKKEKLNLKSSSIIINKVDKVSDSISIINYSNSYSNKPIELKVVRETKGWRVDFSYTFSGNLPILQ
jgi:hypothetical protein